METFNVRFIPAGAGNTTVASAQRPARAVYPRWRGEHDQWTEGNPGVHGLSPLARGTPADSARMIVMRRFIPAGAGNTKYPKKYKAVKAVYPRWRGEHTIVKSPPIYTTGLSPLARGTRREREQERTINRFIPAGAGNTTPPVSGIVMVSVYPRWRGEHSNAMQLN